MNKVNSQAEYLSLKKASELCDYSQMYLSLRARQGKLQATKIGRNWVTTKEWLKEYIGKAEEYKNGNGIHKEVAPPENLPAELFYEEEPMDISRGEHGVFAIRRKPNLFTALGFGVGVATLLLLLSFGVAFGKDGWYQLGRELAGSVQDMGNGFDTSAKKIARNFNAQVNQFAEICIHFDVLIFLVGLAHAKGKKKEFHEIICKMVSNYISYDFFYLFSICSKRGRPIENTF